MIWPDPQELQPSYHEQFPDLEYIRYKRDWFWLLLPLDIILWILVVVYFILIITNIKQ
jgi:hypothetical protein